MRTGLGAPVICWSSCGQRRVLVELDVDAADGAQHARARGREHAEDGTQDEGKGEARDDDLQREEEPIPKSVHLAEGHLPAQGIEKSF